MNYKEAYFTLFNALSNAIELLKQAQIKTEELYMSARHDEDECEEA